MLSARPWRTDAVFRFAGSVLVCFFAGALVFSVVEFRPSAAHPALAVYGVSACSLVCLAASLFLLRAPWRLETVPRRLIAFLGFLYLGIFLAWWVGTLAGTPTGPSVAQMLAGTLSLQGVVLFWTFPFVREHRVSWRESFGFAQNWPRAVLLGLMITCVFLPFGQALQDGSAYLLEWLGNNLPHWNIKPERQLAVQSLEMAKSFSERVVLGVVTIALAPVAEETLFRGILYPWVKQAGFPSLALWGTVLLFAFMHFNLVTFVPLAVLALALTLLYEHTDNLLAPITAHALFNAVNFVKLYSLQEHLK